MGKTPAQKKRNKYLASVRARGASGHNFWFVSPPQDTQALPLTLSSDIELGDFFYLEGSPDVAFVDYFPVARASALAPWAAALRYRHHAGGGYRTRRRPGP